MTTRFLTVKEAALLKHKSPSSIRRIIYPIIDDDQHPDRGDVEPSVPDAQRFRSEGVSFAWRLSEELLNRAIPDNVSHSQLADPPHGRTSSTDVQHELIVMLQNELVTKNEQIKQQANLLAQLGERIREGNLLINSLQSRLALPEGHQVPISEPITAKPVATKSEKGSGRSSKTAKPKRGLFSRIFRPDK